MKIIDLDDCYDFDKNHLPDSINIPYHKLIANHKAYLNKSDKFYLTCKKGVKSKKAVSILKVYGYNVEQIKK